MAGDQARRAETALETQAGKFYWKVLQACVTLFFGVMVSMIAFYLKGQNAVSMQAANDNIRQDKALLTVTQTQNLIQQNQRTAITNYETLHDQVMELQFQSTADHEEIQRMRGQRPSQWPKLDAVPKKKTPHMADDQ